MDKKYADYLLTKGRSDYNKIAKNFSDTRAFLWKELVPFINKVKPNERILDLGCGNGRLFSSLKEKGADYVGVDSSGELVKIAKEKYWQENPKFQVVEALELPFPENYFDKVFSIAVLHHIPSNLFRKLFLKEARRVLKPKGLLVLTVWNLREKSAIYNSLIKYTILRFFGKSKLDKGDIFYPWKDQKGSIVIDRYFHCFKKKELVRLVEDSGFKVNESGFLARGKDAKANIYVIAEKS